MSTQSIPRYTQAEYLRFERDSETKHEFIDGLIVAMAGGTPVHSLIATNIAGELRSRLRGKCRVYTSDLRVCLSEDRLLSYPDVSVVCGSPLFLSADANTLTNPAFVVEVLSPATEKYDRGHKSMAYREMPSIQVFLLVAQQPVDVELWERNKDGGWTSARFTESDAVIPIRVLEIELPASEIYLGID